MDYTVPTIKLNESIHFQPVKEHPNFLSEKITFGSWIYEKCHSLRKIDALFIFQNCHISGDNLSIQAQ